MEYEFSIHPIGVYMNRAVWYTYQHCYMVIVYIAKACCKIISEKENEFDKMKYLLLLLDSYNRTGKRNLMFVMTPHVHHWDSMMIFESTTKSLFPSDLFIEPGINKPVVSDDLSEQMLALYRATGIFASEQPVRNTVKRLIKLSPSMVYPMHGS